MNKNLRTKLSLGTRLISALVLVMIALIGGVMAAAAAPPAQSGPNPVDVTVEDANGPLANRTVYVFDETGSSYLNLSATTGPAGEAASFSLADGVYTFASDDVNGQRYFSATCDATGGACTAATVTQPVFGAVDVTVTDGVNPIANQVVYVFDGTGSTYLNLSATTNGSGLASFNLPAGDYTFAADDTNGTRYFTDAACTVPGCASDTLTMPVFGTVNVTVTDGANPIANQVVYVFDGTGSTYLNLSATTNGSGLASFNLPAGDYTFAADDTNGTRYFTTAACTVPGCVSDTLTMPVFGAVNVTVTDGANPIANQVVYVFDGTGSTYLNLSATTNGSGVAGFNLPAGDYTFAADDTNGTRYFTTAACTVPGCASDTLTMPAFGGVAVTVEDANGPLADRTVYVFDSAGTTYLNLSAVTGPAGEAAAFNLPSGSYTFASDDVNSQRYFSAVCDMAAGCVTAAVTQPVFGAVDVTVTDGTNPVPDQVVYAFDGTGSTYLNLSATTGPNGEPATFNLPVGDYTFAADDTNGTRFFTAGICTVPTCTSDTLLLAAVVATPVDVTVTNAGGAPVPNQLVTVYTVDINGVSTPTTISATTDISGTVSFDLNSGDYAFVADDSNGARYSSQTCSVPACASASLFLFSAVTATVQDTTGAAVANQLVYVYDDTIPANYLNLSATTDVSGTVSFDLDSGSYMFHAYDANGSGFSSVPVPCTAPDCDAATIVMPVYSAVEVTVTDGLNTVPGKLVEVYTVDTNGLTATTTISATTGLSGTVSFALAEDSYQFAAADDLGATFFSDTCTVPACNTASLVLAAIEAVTVTVQDATGAPLSDQIVYVLDATGAETAITGTTNISGTVNFNLPAGDYTFAADSAENTRYFSNLCSLPGCTDALIILPASAVTLPAATCAESGGVRTCELWATTGSLTLPDGSTVDIWGYTDVDPANGGAAQLPGPMIIGNQGETIEVILHNDLPNGQTSSLLFKSLNMVPDMNGVAAGGSKTYSFNASSPGTFLYQAGLTDNGNRQVAMGMYGALIIRPVDGGAPVLDQAYGSSATRFDDEALVLVSEIDPGLNNNPNGFDLRDFKPQYWLINGKAYPQTSLIQTLPGHKVLLRYLNAGLDYHSMGVLGLSQTLLGANGNPLPGIHDVSAETLASGQTLDAIVTIPAATEQDTRFALYDTSVILHNAGDAGFGGMLTFLSTLPDGTTRDLGGPATTEVILSPDSAAESVNVDIMADVSDVDNGGDNINGVEFFVGAPGGNGSGSELAASDGAFDSPAETAIGTIPASALDGLPSGFHTIYVHGQDSQGNWGPLHPVVLHLDKNGPASTGLELSPNPGGGSGEVTLTGTADDRYSGNSNITAAQYSVDGGAATAMNVNVEAPVAGLYATVNVTGLSAGVHTVAVQSQDAFGHWGPAAVIELLVDQSGPDTLAVELLPDANNGTLPVNASLFSMRVNATVSDPETGGVQSNIQAVEGFINYQPGTDQDGTGFPLTPADGRYNSPTEDAYAFIPLSTVNALADGVHTIGIHAKDASGNWGAVVNANLIIDKGAPTVSGLSATPNPTNGEANVALAATAADAATAIALAEWFEGADPGPGNGMPMAVAANGDLSGAIDVTGWADGDYTISVRARDAAGNWSDAVSITLTVADAPTPVANRFYFSTVGGGNANPIAGVAGPYDDADIYHWNSAGFTRFFDSTAANLPPNADIDGLKIDGTLYYMSFSRSQGTNVPGLGSVEDEDIVFFDTENGEWDFLFQGADACGLGNSNGQNIDALDVVGGVIYFSTVGVGNGSAVEGVPGPYDDADIYTWNGTACGRVFDARSGAGNLLPTNADIDGLTVVDADTFYMSFNANTTNVPGLGAVQDEDIVLYDAGVWSVFFDGGANSLQSSTGQDLDAIDVKW